MIEFHRFSFAYNNSDLIFSDLDLSINKNEVTILTGPNGSGKSTLCRLIMGLTRSYQGKLVIDGNDSSDLSTVKIAGIITHLKQESGANIVSALPNEDLEIWLHKFKSSFNISDYDVQTALDYFELTAQSEQPVWELSSGQLKRVGLAALMLNRNKFWLLDEPSTGLDAVLLNKLRSVIYEQKMNGQGMLIISHRFRIFDDVADRRLEIKDKKIVEIK